MEAHAAPSANEQARPITGDHDGVMDILILGGTRFVGRALVDDARARGWSVTTLNRGITGEAAAGVETLQADRTDPAAVAAAIAGRRWDAVVDTWTGDPAVATSTASALVGATEHYTLVSSISVYEWGQHRDETSPLVEGDPFAVDVEYPAAKRGTELGVLASFPEAVLARAGLILGPHEDIGRLPWWLTRIAAGGRVIAPGRPARPLQYIDARDLARWILDGPGAHRAGAYDAVGPSGATTTEGLLRACIEATGSDAELVWVSQEDLAAAGIEPWTHLPCWAPEGPGFDGFLESDTSKAIASGLTCRPIEETVADTWGWLRAEGPPAQRTDRATHGIPPELERAVLERH